MGRVAHGSHAEVSQCRSGMGMAVGLPGDPPLHRPRHRPAAASPPSRDGPAARREGRSSPRRHPEASHAPHCATRSRPTCWRAGTIFALPKELLGRRDVTTTQIYTHVLNRGPFGVRSPADQMPEALPTMCPDSTASSRDRLTAIGCGLAQPKSCVAPHAERANCLPRRTNRAFGQLG